MFQKVGNMINKEIIITNNYSIKNLFLEEATPFSEDMKEISSNETNEILNFVGEINSHEIDICNENKSHDKVLYLFNKYI